MQPRASIVIPCYNDGRFLEEAIRSVERYSNTIDYELIIVNDGSNEAETLKVLNTLSQKGYKVLHQENRGPGAARNHGIRAAQGVYILPLDSDNKIRPRYISEGIRILDNEPRIGVVYGNAEYFGEKTGVWTMPDFCLAELIRCNFIDTCAVFRRSVWEEVGGYDENRLLMGWEDWDFWLRIAIRSWGFYHSHEVLFDYRVRNGSLVSTVPQRLPLLYDYIFSKSELASASLISAMDTELRRLRSVEASRDYRLGRRLLGPLRRVRRFIQGNE
jgi:glycosyltransferase involved in cell wall biosynthesis